MLRHLLKKGTAGFPPRGTGGDQGPPQYFSQKNPDFYRGLGGTMDPPKKNGVLEVVDDPPWSCDPTVPSIWLAVSKEVEEKGDGAIFLKKGKSSVPCACGAVLLAM